MTVEQIALLLETDELTPQIAAGLQNDGRASVSRLLDQYSRRQQRQAAEAVRLDRLDEYERRFRRQGYSLIAGVDEAGRGPLAGPVVVGAVILPAGCRLNGLDDSKKLTPRQRETLYDAIKEAALAVSCVAIDAAEIDRDNIYQATLAGMYRALAALTPAAEAVLIDAMPLRRLAVPNLSLIGGDALSASIAAASIIAKVERDRIMTGLDSEFPEYGFSRHKGYATREHLEALARCGPCPVHRRSFAPVKITERGTLFDED